MKQHLRHDPPTHQRAPMRLLLLAALLAAAQPAAAQPADQPAAQPADQPADQAPVTYRQLHRDIVLQPDGTHVDTAHIEIALGNDASARQQAQQSNAYTEGLEQLELTEAYTRKPDGTRLPVTPEAIRTTLAPGVPNAPEYNDRKQLVAIFPGVAGGDVLVLTWRRSVRQPPIPGYASFVAYFTTSIPWDDAEITIDTPLGLPLLTEQHGPTLAVTDTPDGRTRYRWTFAAPARANNAAALSPLDRAPRLFASTFPDWTTFARSYAAMVEPKATVTARIQALADEIAAPATSRRDEARLLYEWVATNIRWVAIYIGNGGYEPHAADHTLTNRYGDCKDQVVLLMALLRARGIPAQPVIINLYPTYTRAAPPTVQSFNHLITHIPEWDLYADTTTGGAPFGTLHFEEYGKQVVLATAAGPALATIPPLAPGFATTTLNTTMTLDSVGAIRGTTETTGTGPYVAPLRAAMRNAQSLGSNRAVATQLKALGLQGSGAFAMPAKLEMGQQDSLAGHFTLAAQPGLLDGDSLALPTGLRVLARPGNGPLGPLDNRDLPATEPTPCFAATQDETLSLTLPPDWRAATLPRKRRIQNPAFTYESAWTQEAGTIRVHRRLESTIDTALCTGPLRQDAARAMIEIRRDLEARITFEKVN